MRSHIVRALPDLWMNQVALNNHKRGQSPLLLPVKLWFNIKKWVSCAAKIVCSLIVLRHKGRPW